MASANSRDVASVVEAGCGLMAGLIGVGSTALLVSRPWTQSTWEAATFLALLLVASVTAGNGSRWHANRSRLASCALLWLAMFLSIIVAVWSALGLLFVAVAVLSLSTALLGTWRQVRVVGRPKRAVGG